jgi:polygalacturonase
MCRRRAVIAVALLSLFLGLGGRAWADDQTALPAVPRPRIPDRAFAITDYGAKGDGTTMNTDAITKAIAACKAAGGGVVVVPAGKFLTGPFALASKTNLRLDQGATLFFTDADDAFPVKDHRHQHAITAEDCTDVAITGRGTIDGNGNRWWVEFRKVKGTPRQNQQPRRPNLVDLTRCRRVLVQGVTLKDSPNFHLVPRDCDDVTVEGIRITAPHDAPNTDGMDPSGHNYLITRCTFDVGDDCIAVKPQGKPQGSRLSCENFTVTDCTFNHGHGLSIGGQTPGGMRHMVVRNCTFDGTDAGIRMKGPRGQGGLVEDLTYENITMKNVKVALFITSYYPNNTTPKEPDKDPPRPVTQTTPIWRHIRIRNLTATDCGEAGRIFGLPESPIQDLLLENVHISAKKGMQIFNAKDVQLKDCTVTASAGPAWTVRNAQVSGLAAR